MPQRIAANTRAREDLKAAEMLVNYYTYIRIADKPETNYIYRAKDYSIELTPSITATKLAPKLVYRRFNYNTLSYLS
jgi:hypothetical protein